MDKNANLEQGVLVKFIENSPNKANYWSNMSADLTMQNMHIQVAYPRSRLYTRIDVKYEETTEPNYVGVYHES